MSQESKSLLDKLSKEYVDHKEKAGRLIPICPTGHEEFFRKLNKCRDKK